MKIANRMTALLLGMLTFGFVLVGCGDDKADDAPAGDETTENAEATEGGDVDLKASMMTMADEMHDIVSGINSVEDVEAAKGDITKVFDGLIADMTSAIKGGTSMEEFGAMMEDENDPEMKAVSEKMEKAVADLEERSPEAATALEEVMNKEGMRMMTAAMSNISPEDMQKAMEQGMEELGEEAGEMVEEATDAVEGK